MPGRCFWLRCLYVDCCNETSPKGSLAIKGLNASHAEFARSDYHPEIEDKLAGKDLSRTFDRYATESPACRTDIHDTSTSLDSCLRCAYAKRNHTILDASSIKQGSSDVKPI